MEQEAVLCARQQLDFASLNLSGDAGQKVILDALDESELTPAKLAAAGGGGARCRLVAESLEPLIRKRRAFSDRVDKLLRQALGAGDWGDVPTESQRRRMYTSIPRAIIDRVNSWNSGPQPRLTEDILFIGAARTAPLEDGGTAGAGAFSLDSGLTRRRVLRARLHASDSSVALLRGHSVQLLLAEAVRSSPGRFALHAVTDWLPVASDADEVSVDTTRCVKAALRQLAARRSAVEVEMRFVLRCPACNFSADALPLSVMDVTVEVDGPRLRARRSPAESSATRLCRSRDSAGGVGASAVRGGCCMSSFAYDLTGMPGVISPRQLTVSYCTGHCHAQSEVKNTHSGFKQAMAHSSNSGLTYLQKQELSLCCVPDQYRGFKILMGNPGDLAKVEIREIPEVSVESCTCA